MKQPSRAHQKASRPSTRRAHNPPETPSKDGSSKIELTATDSVKKAGEKGILQIQLLKKLGIDNRKGSKLFSRLEEQGVVKRSRELYGGKWTFRLTSPSPKPAIVSWGDLDCPCFFCNDAGRCSLGNILSPSSCSFLSGWLKSFMGPTAECSQNGA